MWWYAKLKDRVGLTEISLGQTEPRSAKLTESGEYAASVASRRSDPQVEIACCSRQLVSGQRVRSDDQVSDSHA